MNRAARRKGLGLLMTASRMKNKRGITNPALHVVIPFS